MGKDDIDQQYKKAKFDKYKLQKKNRMEVEFILKHTQREKLSKLEGLRIGLSI